MGHLRWDRATIEAKILRTRSRGLYGGEERLQVSLCAHKHTLQTVFKNDSFWGFVQNKYPDEEGLKVRTKHWGPSLIDDIEADRARARNEEMEKC